MQRLEGGTVGQVLHRGATTTEAVRRAIQHSQESLRRLARRHGINQKTVAKWRKRCSVADLRTGPKHPRSTVLTVQEEAVIVAFRRHTMLPLDDCLYALQATIPHLTRSSCIVVWNGMASADCQRWRAASLEGRSLSGILPLRQPSTAPCAPQRLRRRLQLRQTTQDARGPHGLRIHLHMLAKGTRSIYSRSDPSNAGTKQLTLPAGPRHEVLRAFPLG